MLVEFHQKQNHKHWSSRAGMENTALVLTVARKTWIFILASQLTGNVTLGKSFMPQFYHM